MEIVSTEIIVKILKQLPQEDLVNCTTVCKLFNEIITKYKLIQTLIIHRRCDFTSPISRIYSKIVIHENNEEGIKKALQITGKDILEVKFEDLEVDLSTIANILCLTPNVRKISFCYVMLHNENEDVSNITLPTLKDVELCFDESFTEIFKILLNVQMRKLEIIQNSDGGYDFSYMLPVMAKQKELESFSMDGLYETNLIYEFIPWGPYHLKEFSFVGGCEESHSNLTPLLNEHKNSLEYLSLSILSLEHFDLIKSSKNLKVLHLGDVIFNETPDEMSFVEELKIVSTNEVAAKFPNIKKLSIENSTAEINRLIQGDKIVELIVHGGTLEGIHFRNLRKLKFVEGNSIDSFWAIHSKIEELELENNFWLDDALLDPMLSNMVNLKVLKIYGVNKLSAQLFKIVQKYCKCLCIIDIRTPSQKYSIEDWKCLYEINQNIKIYASLYPLSLIPFWYQGPEMDCN